MHPNIIIGNIIIPSWYALLLAGIFISIFLAIYLRPSDFPLSRKEIFVVAILLTATGLFGARILFILLHVSKFKLADLFSFRGGFAYFGSLILAVLTLLAYSAIRKIKFLLLLDYALPFLMLNQALVRMGCFSAGCCYGKPTAAHFGIVFKSVDGLIRHPTQLYMALLVLSIYVISRLIYERKRSETGFTFSTVLILYGLGRFFVEHFRTDSPIIFAGLTLAQVSCLILALVGLALFIFKK